VSDLHCFTDDCDTCVASSIEDAEAVMREYGITEHDPECWERVEDATEITIHCDSLGQPAIPGDPGVEPITKTAAEWVASRGRGFLCTSEW
jgi:hypothetical protein